MKKEPTAKQISSRKRVSVAKFFQNKWNVVLVILLAIFIVSRFILIEQKNPFGWDQVDNAWAAKAILVNHKLPLVGMQAKNNSGIYIGPLYYYFVAIFYFFTNLQPVAAGIIAGATAVFSFLTLYFVTRRLFQQVTAIIAVSIYTISQYAHFFDRIQWPVNFIMPLSLLIFYCLYQVIQGKEKYILFVALLIGLFFHIHFTAIFFLLIVFASLPLLPRTKSMVRFSLLGFGMFFLLMIPILVAQSSHSSSAHGIETMLATNYHGVHLQRIMQLAGDAVIKFESILNIPNIGLIKFLILPAFFLLFLKEKVDRMQLAFVYLVALWFIVPWLVFSTYSGEISDYYFSLTLPFVYISLSYITYRLIAMKRVAVTVLVAVFWLYFAYINLTNIAIFYGELRTQTIADSRRRVNEKIATRKIIPYKQGESDPYMYFLYLRETNNTNLLKKYYN